MFCPCPYIHPPVDLLVHDPLYTPSPGPEHSWLRGASVLRDGYGEGDNGDIRRRPATRKRHPTGRWIIDDQNLDTRLPSFPTLIQNFCHYLPFSLSLTLSSTFAHYILQVTYYWDAQCLQPMNIDPYVAVYPAPGDVDRTGASGKPSVCAVDRHTVNTTKNNNKPPSTMVPSLPPSLSPVSINGGGGGGSGNGKYWQTSFQTFASPRAMQASIAQGQGLVSGLAHGQGLGGRGGLGPGVVIGSFANRDCNISNPVVPSSVDGFPIQVTWSLNGTCVYNPWSRSYFKSSCAWNGAIGAPMQVLVTTYSDPACRVPSLNGPSAYPAQSTFPALSSCISTRTPTGWPLAGRFEAGYCQMPVPPIVPSTPPSSKPTTKGQVTPSNPPTLLPTAGPSFSVNVQSVYRDGSTLCAMVAANPSFGRAWNGRASISHTNILFYHYLI